MVFERMRRGKETWITPELFSQRQEDRCIKQKKYYEANHQKLLDQKKEYYQQNQEQILAEKKIYHQENREHKLAYNKEYYKNNHSQILAQKKEYHQKNKEAQNAYCKEWYQNNKEAQAENKKIWHNNNRDHMNAHRRNRMATDPLFRLRCMLSTRLWEVRNKNGYTKKSRLHQILGCSYKELVLYIESQFTKGMTWDNQGEWHLDHILPVAAATTEEELIALNHHTNFQPMWATENISKGDKYCPKELEKYLNKMIEVA